MDFSSVLSALWNKVSKPIPNILIGAVFVFLAPENIRWMGYIFIAIGLGSIVEYIWLKIIGVYNSYCKRKSIEETLRSLNVGEKGVVGRLISKNEQTLSINYNDYHQVMGEAPLGGRHKYVELFGICTGLQSKGVFVTASLDEITSFSVYPEIWKIMKKLYKEDPSIFGLKAGE